MRILAPFISSFISFNNFLTGDILLLNIQQTLPVLYHLFYFFSDSSNAPVKLLEADTLSTGKLLSLDAVLVSIKRRCRNNDLQCSIIMM